MSISAAIDREALGGLADALIPSADGMPSATEAGTTGALLDEVLRVREDLEAPLATLTAAAAGRDPSAEIARLQAEAPELFEALTCASGSATRASRPSSSKTTTIPRCFSR